MKKPNMKYRRFGKTGLVMPVISCGGMRFQDKWEDYPSNEAPKDLVKRVGAIVERAFELGINHFETARGYGGSEVLLGQTLPALPRDEIIVQTKVPPAENPDDFEKKLETSFRKLRLDRVDLLAVHAAFNSEARFENTLRCAPVLEKWVELGRIGHLGVSGHGDLDMLTKTIQTDLFSFVNVHYYYVDQRLAPALKLALEKDLGVFIISPSDKGGKLYDPPDKLKQLTAPLSPMRFNDLFCLANPAVHTVSVGAARPDDFDEHVDIIDQLDQAKMVVAPIVQRLRNEVNAVMGKGWSERYADGVAPWSDTHNKINIEATLRLLTLAKAFDMVEFFRYRFKEMSAESEWQPGNKPGRFSDVDIAPAIERSPFADIIPSLLREANDLMGE